MHFYFAANAVVIMINVIIAIWQHYLITMVWQRLYGKKFLKIIRVNTVNAHRFFTVNHHEVILNVFCINDTFVAL